MAKHTQTIRRLFPANCFSVFHHFVKLALKGWKTWQGPIFLRVLYSLEAVNGRCSMKKLFWKTLHNLQENITDGAYFESYASNFTKAGLHRIYFSVKYESFLR